MQAINVRAETLRIGDRVMPPERELRLWMRRDLKERNLPESALYLTIVKIAIGADKNGQWLYFTCDQTLEWMGDAKPYTMTFKARPHTLWPKLGVYA